MRYESSGGQLGLECGIVAARCSSAIILSEGDWMDEKKLSFVGVQGATGDGSRAKVIDEANSVIASHYEQSVVGLLAALGAQRR